MWRWLLALLRSEAGWSRVWVGLGMAIVMAGGGLIYYQAQDAPGTANIWIDTDGGTCTRNSSPAAYSDAAACSSLSAAYAVAACGDTVNIKAGSYGNETITEDADLTGCSQRVVFQEASGESVVYSTIQLGNSTTNGPDHLELHDFEMTQGFATGDSGLGGADIDVNDVIVDAMDGGGLGINGGHDVIIRNSDFGPCHSWPLDSCLASPSNQIVVRWLATNITLEGNYIHNFNQRQDLNPDNHFECIRMDGGATNFILRGNKFWDCQIYATTTTGYAGTTIIENNWFNTCCGIAEPGWNQSITQSSNGSGTLIIRFNTFASIQGIKDLGGQWPQTVYAIGNIFGGTPAQAGGCHSNVTFQYNVWVSGGTPSTCGTGGETVTSLPYVNDANSSNCPVNEPDDCPNTGMDYHLDESSNADDIVPADLANSCAATDIDGTAINCSTIRDAGSDQR